MSASLGERVCGVCEQAQCVHGACLWVYARGRAYPGVRRVRVLVLAYGLLLDPPWHVEKEDTAREQAHPEIGIGPGHTTGLRTRGRRAHLEEVPAGSKTDFKSFDKGKNCKEWKATRYFAES